MGDKKSYFAVIPANVRYDRNLKDKAKLLYGEITSLCNEKGYCWATNEYFANLYGVSKITISGLIKNLIDNGYIKSEIIYKEGTKEILNRYLSILIYPIKENFNTPIKENFKDNNKNINNKINISSCIYLEEQFGRTIAPIEYDKIIQWEEIFTDDIINYAIDKAVLNNIKTLNYIEGILRNWETCNFKTLQEIKESEQKRKSKNTTIEKSQEMKELENYNWLEEE